MARARCRTQIDAGVVEVRAGGAEATGCPSGWADLALSVNNVMLWNRRAGFAELARVLRPGGRLVVSVHRHVLDVVPERLAGEAEGAGFTDLALSLRPRRLLGSAVELGAAAGGPARGR